MDFRIFVEPQQGASYADQLQVAQAAEQLGFDGFFRSDHYLFMGDVDPRPGPSDAWTTLAGLALQTERIRLGTLVTSATFRLPGPLAVTVAQVDEMSGGRIELGLGSGWFEDEHTAFGIPFPPLGERFDRYEEQLEIITGLWATPDGERFSFAGAHYTLTDSPGLPKPRQTPGPPIIIGGGGKKRTPELAARFAAEFNTAFSSLDDTSAQFGRVRAAAEAIGRDPGAIVYSAAHGAYVGRTDAEVRARVGKGNGTFDELQSTPLVGSPQQVVDGIAALAAIGVSRVYLQILDLSDLDHLQLIADEVVPHF